MCAQIGILIPSLFSVPLYLCTYLFLTLVFDVFDVPMVPQTRIWGSALLAVQHAGQGAS